MKVATDAHDILHYDIDEDDVIYFCFEKGWITEEKYRELESISSEEDLSKRKHRYGDVDIEIDDDDALDTMWESDIISYLEEAGHVIDPTIEENDEDISDKSEFVKFLRYHINKHFTRVFDKEDLKKAVSELIDDWYI